ncbi:Tonsoku-like protein [Nymphon striatum]|nr:Tonsoku-like protein [Nymphon striatum]
MILGVKKDKKKAEAKQDWKEYAGLCNYLGQLYSKSEDFEAALAEHKLEKELCKNHGDTIDVAVAHRRIGECYCELGKFEKALSNQERHLVIAKDLSNKLEEQRAWATIGRTYLLKFQKGSDTHKLDAISDPSLNKAQKAFVRALNMCDKLKDNVSPKELMEMKSRLLLNIGLIYDERNDLKECIEFIQKAILINEKYELWEDLHRCHYSLAAIYQRHNEITNSLKYMDLALNSSSKFKDKTLICEALLGKAELLSSLGDFGGAEITLKQAYKQKSIADNRLKIEKRLKIVIKLHKFEMKILDSSTKTAEDLMSLYEKIADGCVHLSAFSQAIKYYHKMLEEHTKLSNPSKKISVIYSSLAHTYLDNKQPDEALKYFKRELKCNNDSKEKGRILLNMAVAAESTESSDSVAKKYYKEAYQCAKEVKDFKSINNCLKALLSFYKKDNDEHRIEVITKEIQTLKSQNGFVSEEDDSDEEDYCQDIDLSYISDLSDNEEEQENEEYGNRTKRRRPNLKQKVNEMGETPLHRACIAGNLKAVKQLLTESYPVNPRDYCGWLPIHEAANHDHYEIVKELIAHGAWINDRGGKDCEGITPLHDAASCGNTNVMRLLIENGASVVALSNTGDSALESLRKWRERTEVDPETLEDCLLLENYLKEKMLKVCHEVPSQTEINERLSDNCIAQKQVSPLSGHESSKQCSLLQNDNLDQNLSINLQASFLGDESFEEESSENFYSNNKEKNNSTDEGRAKKFYKNAILQSKNNVEKDPIQPALIDAEEAVGEDWLVDDINFSTEDHEKDLSNQNKQCHGFSSTNLICQKKSSTHKNLSLTRTEKDNVLKRKRECDDIDKTKIIAPKHMNKSGIIWNSTSKNSNENELVTSATSSNSKSQDLSWSSVNNVVNIDKTKGNVIRVKVKVLDKAFLIPTGCDKMVSWLSSEVSARFFHLTGLRPILSLTLESALMFPNDIISHVVFPDEEIIGKIESWDLPPLTDCYTTACKTLKTFFYANIKTRLEKCEASNELNLDNLSLGMLIGGNQLGDNGIEYLVKSLATLPSLSSLKINNNNLTSKAIQVLANISQPETSFEKPLKLLKELDISCNALGDSCSNSLGELIAKLPNLEKLNISSCNFTAKLFCPPMNKFLAEQNSITEFSFGNNILSAKDLEFVLNSLNCKSIVILNLSGTTTSRCPEVFCHAIGKYISQVIVIKNVSKSGNHDIYFSRELKTAQRLTHISLAHNQQISFESIATLLGSTKNNCIPLRMINLTGCSDFFSHLESGNESEFAQLLKENGSLREINFSRDDVSSHLHRFMMEIWRKNWGSRALVENLPDYSVRFCVKR